jgi:hypothetical protein
MTQTIKFTPELFQKVLLGRKTETRRPVKPQPPQGFDHCFCVELMHKRNEMSFVFSPTEDPSHPDAITMHPKVFPKQCVRLIDNSSSPMGVEVQIRSIRCERLRMQSLQSYELKGEGFSELHWTALANFKQTWAECYGDEYKWDETPWVWVIRW